MEPKPEMQQAMEYLALSLQSQLRPDAILVHSRWFTTDPATMSSELTQEDFGFFVCHFIRRHVVYWEEDAEGRKHYECLECVRDQGDPGL